MNLLVPIRADRTPRAPAGAENRKVRDSKFPQLRLLDRAQTGDNVKSQCVDKPAEKPVKKSDFVGRCGSLSRNIAAASLKDFRRKVSESNPASHTPPPLPCPDPRKPSGASPRDSIKAEVCLVFGKAAEAGGLEDRLQNCRFFAGENLSVRFGLIHGRPVALGWAEDTPAAALRVAESLVLAYDPLWVISAGFAAALDPSLSLASIIVADNLIDPRGQPRSLPLPTELGSWAADLGARIGPLFSADQIPASPEEKRSLGEKLQVLAFDKTAPALLSSELLRNRSLLIVRAIAELTEETRPPDLVWAKSQKTQAARLGALIGTLWRRPSAFKDLWQDHERNVVVGDRLAEFLLQLIPRICPQTTKKEGSTA